MRNMAILALIMGIANTSTLFANEIDGDSVAVRSAAENLFAAGNKGDIKAFEQFFLTDNTVFGPDGGPRSIFKADFARLEFKAGLRYKLRWRSLDIKVYGNTRHHHRICHRFHHPSRRNRSAWLLAHITGLGQNRRQLESSTRPYVRIVPRTNRSHVLNSKQFQPPAHSILSIER